MILIFSVQSGIPISLGKKLTLDKYAKKKFNEEELVSISIVLVDMTN